MKPKEILMVIAISILGALFIGLLFDLFYPNPEYEDYCGERFEKPRPLVVQESCMDVYEMYHEEINQCHDQKGEPRFKIEDGCEVFDYCDPCNKEYDAAREVYERNLFVVISPIAVFFVIFGVLYTFELVGSSFMFAGILLLMYSTIRYFGDMSRITRVIVTFVELLLLLFIAYKKMRNKKKK